MADTKTADAVAPRLQSSHVRLGADWGPYLNGRVLRADPDLLAQLDVEHVPYEPATAEMIGVGATGEAS